MREYFSNIRFLFLIVALILFMPGCNDEKNRYIPYVPVDFYIDLSILNNLKVTGNSMKFPEPGYAGVIVLCEYYDSSAPSQSLYHAYDATCTTEISQDCTITAEDNGILAVCPCCSTKYSLFNGYKVEGEAPRPLQRYKTQLIGERLRVYN